MFNKDEQIAMLTRHTEELTYLLSLSQSQTEYHEGVNTGCYIAEQLRRIEREKNNFFAYR